MNKLKTILTLTTLSTLTACGGGGGGSSSTESGDVPTAAQVVITEQNSEEVAVEVVEGVNGATDASSSLSNLPLGIELDSKQTLKIPAIKDVVLKTIQSLDFYQLNSQNLPMGVAINETMQCDNGGSITYSGNISNSYGMTAGDSIRINANNCNQFGSSLNGSATVDVVSYSYSYSKMNLNYSNFSMSFSDSYQGQISAEIPSLRATVEIWGDIDYGDIDRMNAVMTGTMSTAENGQTRSVSFNNFKNDIRYVSYYDYESELDGLIKNTVNGESLGAFDIETIQPIEFSNYNNYPSYGQLKVNGAKGTLLITANGGSTVTLETDADGNGSYESTKEVAWNDLMSQL